MKTHGHDDPAIPEHVRAAHDRAQARGEQLYRDPLSGLYTMTEAYLRGRGDCCGKTCRHCPWPRAEQARAGRAILRPD